MAARRQRGALRLLPELVAAGIITDASSLMSVVKTLVSGGHLPTMLSVRTEHHTFNISAI